MDADKKTTINSFKLAKTDIARMQRQIDLLEQKFDKVVDVLDTLKSHQLRVSQKVNTLSNKKTVKKIVKKKVAKKTVKKVVKATVKKKQVSSYHKRKTTKFVASKTGKKFHIEACPFAKNIKPKYKVRFHSKVKALNEGYKPCNCVKN
ncbi:MAG: hypothetical protein KAQ83_01225 [Nanoarchaeota archaeon]|nr:hypothetical protein [Nanoarchaeota archaeon]